MIISINQRQYKSYQFQDNKINQNKIASLSQLKLWKQENSTVDHKSHLYHFPDPESPMHCLHDAGNCIPDNSA
jgi:hypothetical protein